MKVICKECESEFESARAGKKYCSYKCSRDYGTRLWRERNKLRYQEKSRQWYHDNKEKAKADQARWVEENRDKINGYRREWASANKSRVADYHRKWRNENPEKAKAVCQRRRARVRSAKVENTTQHRETLVNPLTVRVCFYCGRECGDGFHWDHHIPISKGGPEASWNLVVSCPSCNLRKGGRLPVSVFCEELGLVT